MISKKELYDKYVKQHELLVRMKLKATELEELIEKYEEMSALDINFSDDWSDGAWSSKWS